MAKIANVETSDTFGIWRTRSNAAFDRLSQFAINNSSLYANTVTANNNLNALKNATITKNLLVSGNTTLGAAGKTITSTGVLAHTGRATISTNLTVSGNTTLSGLSSFNYTGDSQTNYKNNAGSAVAYIGTNGAFGGANTDALRFRSDAGEMDWGFSGSIYLKLTPSLLTISTPMRYGGVTLSNSVTGTGSMVLSASPTMTGTLTVPSVNATSAYKLNNANLLLFSSGATVLYDGSERQNIFLGGTGDPTNYHRNGAHLFQTVAGSTMMSATASAVTLNVPLTYGGVTLSNSVTGTGSMVLSASPTFTGTLSAATITATGDITSTSDIGLKSNIEVINNALDKVINMRGITFNRPGFHERSAGVIAQEIECVFPEVVKRNGDGYLTVAYGNMISILIEAIKELKAEIEKLKNGN